MEGWLWLKKRARRRRDACRRKVRHACPVSALRHFIELGASGTGDAGLRVYECEDCGGLHVGHGRVRRLRARVKKLAEREIIARLMRRCNATPPT